MNNQNVSESADIKEKEEEAEADKKKSIVKVENLPSPSMSGLAAFKKSLIEENKQEPKLTYIESQNEIPDENLNIEEKTSKKSS